MNQQMNNGRTIAAVLADMKEELKEFVATRIELLKTELREKSQTLKKALPLAVVGLVLFATAYLLFTLAIVALVFAYLPDNQYRWCFAFLSVGILWGIFGAIAAYFAK